MSFLGGPKWFTNPALQDAIRGLTQGRAEADQAKSAGNQYFRDILKGLRIGDTSGIGNPFQDQLATEIEQIKTQGDSLGNADQQRNLTNLNIERAKQRAGINFQNYVQGAAAGAAQGNIAWKSGKEDRKFGYDRAIADTYLQGNELKDTPGWGALAIGGALGVANLFKPAGGFGSGGGSSRG
jgi:hypothetical protein